MDKRLSKLKITLPEGWKDSGPLEPGAPPAFTNERMGSSGILQISTAGWVSGKVPNPDFSDLVDLSKKAGLGRGFGAVVAEESGVCACGTFGNAQFATPDVPFISIWHLSDGRNFIFATFICTNMPGEQDMAEVKEILVSIRKRSFFSTLFG